MSVDTECSRVTLNPVTVFVSALLQDKAEEVILSSLLFWTMHYVDAPAIPSIPPSLPPPSAPTISNGFYGHGFAFMRGEQPFLGE